MIKGQSVMPGVSRILVLDVLRGLALCGIALVNVAPLTHFAATVGMPPPTLREASGWLQLLVQQRFFPIFSLLFGVGFSLLQRSAQRRGRRPQPVLARRLLMLLPLGVLHHWLHPGEALLPYAVVGLVVLVPSTWLPRWVVALGALLAVVAALSVGGDILLIPGLFLTGAALVRYGVVDQLQAPGRAGWMLLVAAVLVAGPMVWWQAQDVAGSAFSVVSAVAGLALAVVYISLVVVLMQTAVRDGLVAVFAPLGRMALTNYVSATALMLAGGALLELPARRSWVLILTMTTAILLLQLLCSTLWLRYFTQGPLEFFWRWGTWGEKPALRRTGTRQGQTG